MTDFPWRAAVAIVLSIIFGFGVWWALVEFVLWLGNFNG